MVADDPDVIFSVQCTPFLSAYDSPAIRELKLQDEFIGSLLRAKETSTKPVVPDRADPRYRKLVQIWDQLIFQDGLLCDILRMLEAQGLSLNWWFPFP